MKELRPESFVRGAFLLSLAGLVTRLLGAFYRPVIARIFAPFDGHGGAVGIGLTQVPLSAYMVILSFTSVGLNVGISRLVAERIALRDAAGARQVFRTALTLMAALGTLSALAMWVGAPVLADLISDEVTDTIPGFRATAPALVFVSIAAAYRGWFQGLQFMAPNAYSQIIEQLVRVGSGFILTYWLVRYSVPLGAAGFNLGDVVGGAAALAYLLILSRRYGEDLWQVSTSQGVAAQALPRWELYRRLFSVAGPITIVGAVVPLMMLMDTFFVFRSLHLAGVHGADATAQYGMLSNAFMIVYLPAIITSAIYTSLLPAITEAVTLGRTEETRRRTVTALRMTSLFAFPAQAGLFVLAVPIYALFYGDPGGGAVLHAISWATLPIMLQQVTSGVLQGAGRIGLPVGNFLLGALVKGALTAWWAPIWGIHGAAYATVAGFALAALLNLLAVIRIVRADTNAVSLVVKPGVASVLMGGSLVGAGAVLGAGHFQTLLLVGLGAPVYLVALLLLRGLEQADVKAIPKVGQPLANLLVRAHLLR